MKVRENSLAGLSQNGESPKNQEKRTPVTNHGHGIVLICSQKANSH
jgi:hypothetical protein